MDLQRIKSARDDGDAFVIEHHDLPPFRMAKAAMLPHEIEIASAMCRGGAVHGYDDGGTVNGLDAVMSSRGTQPPTGTTVYSPAPADRRGTPSSNQMNANDLRQAQESSFARQAGAVRGYDEGDPVSPTGGKTLPDAPEPDGGYTVPENYDPKKAAGWHGKAVPTRQMKIAPDGGVTITHFDGGSHTPPSEDDEHIQPGEDELAGPPVESAQLEQVGPPMPPGGAALQGRPLDYDGTPLLHTDGTPLRTEEEYLKAYPSATHEDYVQSVQDQQHPIVGNDKYQSFEETEAGRDDFDDDPTDPEGEKAARRQDYNDQIAGIRSDAQPPVRIHAADYAMPGGGLDTAGKVIGKVASDATNLVAPMLEGVTGPPAAAPAPASAAVPSLQPGNGPLSPQVQQPAPAPANPNMQVTPITGEDATISADGQPPSQAQQPVLNETTPLPPAGTNTPDQSPPWPFITPQEEQHTAETAQQLEQKAVQQGRDYETHVANVEKAVQSYTQQNAVNRQKYYDDAVFQLDQQRTKNLEYLADNPVDASRLFRHADWGNVLGVIGLALGTFGSILTKTPNYALQVFNDAIDKDIEAQVRNRSTAEDLVRMTPQQKQALSDEMSVHKQNALDVADAAYKQGIASLAPEHANMQANQFSAGVLSKWLDTKDKIAKNATDLNMKRSDYQLALMTPYMNYVRMGIPIPSALQSMLHEEFPDLNLHPPTPQGEAWQQTQDKWDKLQVQFDPKARQQQKILIPEYDVDAKGNVHTHDSIYYARSDSLPAVTDLRVKTDAIRRFSNALGILRQIQKAEPTGQFDFKGWATRPEAAQAAFVKQELASAAPFVLSSSVGVPSPEEKARYEKEIPGVGVWDALVGNNKALTDLMQRELDVSIESLKKSHLYQ